MYYPFTPLVGGGGAYISGVDVIVYSWLKGLAGTSIWRMSVNNVHAFYYMVHN